MDFAKYPGVAGGCLFPEPQCLLPVAHYGIGHGQFTASNAGEWMAFTEYPACVSEHAVKHFDGPVKVSGGPVEGRESDVGTQRAGVVFAKCRSAVFADAIDKRHRLMRVPGFHTAGGKVPASLKGPQVIVAQTKMVAGEKVALEQRIRTCDVIFIEEQLSDVASGPDGQLVFLAERLRTCGQCGPIYRPGLVPVSCHFVGES